MRVASLRWMQQLPDDLTALAAAYAYPEGPGGTPTRGGTCWLRANMISSLDGAAWFGARTAPLGSPADQFLFATLRGLADVVIAGAQTARVEHYGPVEPRSDWEELRGGRPAVPPLAIVSRQLDLDLDSPLFTEAPRLGARTILLTTETAPADRRREAGQYADVIVAGRDGIDFPRAIEELAARGHRRLLCEGGPTILARAVADDVLDELCLTLSPSMAGGDAFRILNGPQLPALHRMRLHAAYTDDDFLYLRYFRK